MAIHPTAVVDKRAEIDPTSEIGAYAIIEHGVNIGPESRIYPHAYVATGTTLGRGCQIHPFAVIGNSPQDLKYDGAPTYTTVGDETVVREGASIHRGTVPESTTVVGRRCYLMATSHIGHNCVVGDDVKIVNCGLLAGHVEVGDGAFIGGLAGIHQFVRVGALTMIGGGTGLSNDVPPFMMLAPAGVVGTNVVGLRRAGFTAEERQELRACYKALYRSGLRFRVAIERVAESVRTEPGQRLVEFLRAPSKRGYARLKRRDRATAEPESP